MKQDVSEWCGRIHPQDCVTGLREVPAGAVDLVFADPPFNIGYEYDKYDDRLESAKYLDWSRQWISQVHRVLKSTGTFWLAIGDEYAAELKLASQDFGFTCRSWVIWYYTFGVHCTSKFTRSHAHLFQFVKDAQQFTFQGDQIAVPSARQLVYNDARANPAGRMPDDTWILRPQDLPDGLTPEEDTWYFPRVAGTFKERAGFHGCQMPEQLLGRIVRVSSREGEIVVDPFAGSATTLTVAKKLNRQFFGFEISDEYVRLGTKRIAAVAVGDKLVGADDPRISAPATVRGQRSKPHAVKISGGASAGDPLLLEMLQREAQGVLEAFAAANRGYSVDRLIADPILNEDFQQACGRRSVPGAAGDRNRFLLRLRKAGKIKQAGIDTSERTAIDWDELEGFIFASEIAWRKLRDHYCGISLDDILCDPRLADMLDETAARFAPKRSSLEYRWAALKLRKEGSKARARASARRPKLLQIDKQFDATQELEELNLRKIPRGPGVYGIRLLDANYFYAGETNDLAQRLAAHFGATALRKAWLGAGRGAPVEVCYSQVDTIDDYRLARQSHLLKWHQPRWNLVEELGAA